jgi:hypothetical protein
MRVIICGNCHRPLCVTESVTDNCGEVYRGTQFLSCSMCDNSIIIHEKSRKSKWYHSVRKIIMGEI